ncbi:hypothetical protein BC834DRAFT_863479 [Gloeopeniophorella convolvens]|nr:hypothetical protein BC834DRAFT_863479 [Gloeopeniophorella convolvens]
MNSPLEPASPASSSTESLTDDIALTQEFSTSAYDRSERSGPVSHLISSFTRGVGKRRLPGGSTKTTSNRDSKARRREEGSYRKGGPPDRRDNTKGRDEYLDTALFDALKSKLGDPFDDDVIKNSA